MHLITGGSGFIGSHTTRALLDQSQDCLVGTRSGRPGPTGAAVATIDCTDLASLRDVGRRYDIQGVVHLAAGALDPAHPIDVADSDLCGLLNVLRVAAEWNVKRVTVASTIGVYAGPPRDSYREDALLSADPGHLIATLRKTSEALALALSDVTVSVRIGAIWGPGGRPSSRFFAAPQLVRAATGQGWSDQELLLYARDGIDMLYAPDCGRAIAAVHLADELRHRIYNIGSGIVTTNQQVTDALGGDLPVRPGRSRPEPDVPMDISRLRADTGFTAAFTLDRALADFRHWLGGANAKAGANAADPASADATRRR